MERRNSTEILLKSKNALASLTVASGEKWIGELSNRELKEIFRLV